MPALAGQTAERIFTKLSHVVDIRCNLRTYQINLFLALLKLHGGPTNDEILHIFGRHPYLFSSHARTRQNIAILKIGSPRKAALHLCQFRGTLAYKPLRSRRRFTIFFRRTLCQGRTVRACVHSVGMLCGYMPNSSYVCTTSLGRQRTTSDHYACTTSLGRQTEMPPVR